MRSIHTLQAGCTTLYKDGTIWDQVLEELVFFSPQVFDLHGFFLKCFLFDLATARNSLFSKCSHALTLRLLPTRGRTMQPCPLAKAALRLKERDRSNSGPFLRPFQQRLMNYSHSLLQFGTPGDGFGSYLRSLDTSLGWMFSQLFWSGASSLLKDMRRNRISQSCSATLWSLARLGEDDASCRHSW